MYILFPNFQIDFAYYLNSFNFCISAAFTIVFAVSSLVYTSHGLTQPSATNRRIYNGMSTGASKSHI